MNAISAVCSTIDDMIANGKTLEEFYVQKNGVNQINIDNIFEDLFGPASDIIYEFEKRFSGKCSQDDIEFLFKSGKSSLMAYNYLLQQELTKNSSPLSYSDLEERKLSLSKLNENRLIISEKMFIASSALRLIDEICEDIKSSVPSSNILSDMWFGPTKK
jgi:hypothetical protein